MLRIRITADTFLAIGPQPVEFKLNSAKQQVKIPGVHGRVYEPGEEVEIPERHPDGRPFVLNPDTMELLDGTPIEPDPADVPLTVEQELALARRELAELRTAAATTRAGVVTEPKGRR